MSQPQNEKPAPPIRQPRAWWQYVIAAMMFTGAGWFVLDGYVFKSKRHLGFDRLDPLPIRVDPSLAQATRIDAEPGSLSGSNVLLVTFDTTRADRLHCYGNSGVDTPNLDRLAKRGVLFADAVAAAPTTLPSHTSMLTGLYPFHHGARANANYRLNDDKTTLAEVLQQQGYVTAAFISAKVLQGSYGLSQGFDLYSDDVTEGDPRPWTGDPVLPGNKTTDRAIKWLGRHTDKPFFTWVHYFDPHAPHAAPPPYDKKYPVPYDGEIAFADEQLGRLLLALKDQGRLERTLVIVVGDHGESMGQHGELTHGFLIHDATLRVPMIMACGSRLGGGVQVARRVSQVDVLPTVLSLLGLEPPGDVDGVDLTREIPQARPLYSDTLEGYVQFGLAPLAALFDGAFKYIHGPHPELYDLSTDPFEERNIIDDKPKVAARLLAEMQSMVGTDVDASLLGTASIELDPVVREELAALGYVRDSDTPEGPLKDPKPFLAIYHEVERAVAVDVHFGHEKALPMFRKIVSRHPDSVTAYRHLGDAERRAGHDEEAEEAYLKCVALHPGALQPRIELGQMALRRKDYAAAERFFSDALKVGPGRLAVIIGLGISYTAQGKFEDAARILTEGFKLYKSDPEITERMVEALIRVGRRDECRRLLSEALEGDPRLIVVRNALAGLLANNGKRKEAVELLREGLELYPDTPELISNLGLVLATSMDDPDVYYPTEATLLLERVCQKTGYTDPRYMQTLSLAYWSLKRVDEALAMAERARKVAEEQDNKRMVRSISETIQNIQKAKAAGVSANHRISPTMKDRAGKSAGKSADKPGD